MKKDKILKCRIEEIENFLSYAGKVPFVRCLVLNGSFASGKFREGSDVDILTIAKSGRIFTARFFLNVKAFIHGDKRSADDSISYAGKFCLNYFLADNFLGIPHDRGEDMDRYCAENYSQSLLLLGDERLFKRFLNKNDEWFCKYIGFKKVDDNKFRKKLKEVFPVAREKGSVLEKMLSGKVGDKLESFLKYLQIKKIEKDPRTKKYSELIVYNDQELRFHPPKK